MRINRKLKDITLLFYLVILSVFTSINVQGQIKGAQISDNSVLQNASNPLSFSILDLSSVERGFLLPRMTMEQRQAIPLNNLQPGLMIYNTTRECIEFFSATRNQWLGLCGDGEPAEFVITDESCGKIRIEGNYNEGVFLQSRVNLISMEVSVSTPGTYQIEAEAYNGTEKNGYAFSSSGVFPSSGTYNIVLRATGTPKKGYSRDNTGKPTSVGDIIKFKFNGKDIDCQTNVFVEKESLQYQIDRVVSSGEFYTGVNLQDKHSGYLDVYINQITMGGIVEIYTPEVNGIRFIGKRALTTAEVAAKQAIIRLSGEGTPLLPRTTPLDFISNSYVRLEQGESPNVKVANVEIERLNFDVLCDNTGQYRISHQGEFEYNQPLTNDHKLHVPVKVLAPGRGKLVATVDVTGSGFGQQTQKIEFSSEVVDFEFNSLRDDVQNVVLTPVNGTGMPTVSNKDIIFKFKILSKGAHDYDNTYPIENNDRDIVGCEYSVPVTGAPVQYEILWDNLQIGGKLRPYLTATNANYIDVPVKVIFPGEAIIESDVQVNGVSYKGSKVLTDNDINTNGGVTTIRLQATGRPEKADQSVFNIKGNSIGNSPQVGPVTVPILYRPMVLLSSGTTASYRIDNGESAGLLNNKDYFGPNGLVKIESLILVSGSHTSAESFLSALTDNKVDIVIGSLYFRFNDSKNNVLYDFLVNKKGAAMINNESNELDAARFINLLAGGGSATISGQNTFHRLISTDDPLLVGPFGDLRGLTLGEDRGGRTINNLPSSYIAYDADPSKRWVIRHNKYNFVYTGDSGFTRRANVYGVNGNSTKATVTTGRGSSGDSNLPTYNSHFTMNFLAYAIDQIQRDRPNE
ncbi:hypothetical protein ACKLNQ_17070 [Myroides odoratimimus]|uniref:hypothetical protein n=1 Tax=Myroides odoratimimus TaxID=76832 RepID=UPI0038D42930